MRLTSSSEQENFDKDGLLMLAISTLIILLSLGLSFFIATIYALSFARNKKNCQVGAQKPAILFGFQLVNNQIQPSFAQRLDKFLECASSFNQVFLLGGKTKNNAIAEAEAGRDYLLNQQPGLVTQIRLELDSRNTLENLKQARKQLQAAKIDLNVVLITHQYHMARCYLMAKNLGYQTDFLIAEMTGFTIKNKIIVYLLEGFLIHWYLTGLVIANLLKNKRMLNKIK